MTEPEEPTLVRCARAGDLEPVQQIIYAAAHDPHIYSTVVNEARVWKDYQEGDYENNWDWYDDTPLIAAARNGQVEVVLSLLETGYCDPTLESCPKDDVYESALMAAQTRLKQLAKFIEYQRPLKRSCLQCAMKKPDVVEELAKQQEAETLSLIGRYEEVIAILEAALEMWEKAPYSSPRAGSRTSFTNRMKDPDNKPSSLGNEDSYDLLVGVLRRKMALAREKVTSSKNKVGLPSAGEQDPATEESTIDAFVGSA